ncbi:MAG: EndoU domain-containing protein [Alphaproteobacteria bacterium]
MRRPSRLFKHPRNLALALLVAAIYYMVNSSDHRTPAPDNTPGIVTISEKSAKHILHGDGRGGGHLYGTGTPCKTEFPADWSENDVLQNVKLIAANDNLDWREQDNGYYVAESLVQGVKVRVVLGKDKQNVVTAYPVNRPRNPCPANDN